MRGCRALTLLSLLATASAFGQQSDSKGSGCDSKNWDVAIRACTALIESHNATENTIVTSYLNRAEARVEKDDIGGGLLDVNEAVRRQPANTKALYLRASIYILLGDFSLAAPDLDATLLLSPDDAYAHWLHGLVHLESGDPVTAFDDLKSAQTKIPDEPYFSLLLYLAQARLGVTDASQLDKALAGVKSTAWPRPIVDFYRGIGTSATVLAAAASSDSQTELKRQCEAYFYFGEMALLQGKKDEASHYFQQAVDTGVATYFEHASAAAELSGIRASQQIDADQQKSKQAADVVEFQRQIAALEVRSDAPATASALAPAAMRAIVPDIPDAESVPQTMQTGRFYALVIGINQYPTPLPSLKTAVADAQSVAKVLRERYGFDVKMLLDAQATRNNILQAITQYRLDLKENDSLLIYYAGHGYSDKEADKAYWLPVDADSSFSPNRIIADDLTSDVKVQPARHVLIISDSCYSGGLSRDADVVPRGSDEEMYLRKMLNGRSRNLMASGGDEPVFDSGAEGHSVFAYAVLRALTSEDKSMFTASDLFYNSVRQQVAGKSDQVPEYSVIRNSSHDDGDFIFVQKRPGQ